MIWNAGKSHTQTINIVIDLRNSRSGNYGFEHVTVTIHCHLKRFFWMCNSLIAKTLTENTGNLKERSESSQLDPYAESTWHLEFSDPRAYVYLPQAFVMWAKISGHHVKWLLIIGMRSESWFSMISCWTGTGSLKLISQMISLPMFKNVVHIWHYGMKVHSLGLSARF